MNSVLLSDKPNDFGLKPHWVRYYSRDQSPLLSQEIMPLSTTSYLVRLTRSVSIENGLRIEESEQLLFIMLTERRPEAHVARDCS
jgi:hypothetical protein